MESSHPQRLRAIDGLRGIAVLSVLLFHFSPVLLPGGYLGVDIFFVISGFVISLMADSDPRISGPDRSPWHSLAYFYSRRALRIFPALVACILISSALFFLFVPPTDFSRYGISLGIPALFSYSNIFLMQEANHYFAPGSELNVLLHTWSLGVEMQFYLLFPFIFWLGARLTYGWLPLLLAAAGSLALFYLRDPLPAFYSLSSRFWEPAWGVLIYLLAKKLKARPDPKWDPLLGYAASIAMILPVFLAERGNFQSLLPVLTASGVSGLLLLVHQGRGGPVEKILSVRWITFLGLISYSLYLVHWPLLALARWTTGTGQWTSLAGIAILSLFLAALSRRYLELPFLRTKLKSRSAIYHTAAASLLILLFSSTLLGLGKAQWEKITFSKIGTDRDWTVRQYVSDIPRCQVQSKDSPDFKSTFWGSGGCATGPGRKNIFIVGDSHARSYLPVFQKIATIGPFRIHYYSRPGCLAFNGNVPLDRLGPGCTGFLQTVFADIVSMARPGDILFSPGFRGKNLTDPGGEARPELLNINLWPVNVRDRELWIRGAESELAPLTAVAGLRIVIEAPKPVQEIALFRCSDWFNKNNPHCRPRLHLSREQQLEFRRPVLEALKIVAGRNPSVEIFDPFPLLCPPGEAVCPMMHEGHPIFLDHHHLSQYGGFLLFEALLKLVQ